MFGCVDNAHMWGAIISSARPAGTDVKVLYFRLIYVLDIEYWILLCIVGHWVKL